MSRWKLSERTSLVLLSFVGAGKNYNNNNYEYL